MLLHYLKIAFRHIQRHYVISIVNIGGLSIGLTAALLVATYVANEYSYDRFHKQGGRIVKVEFSHDEGDKSYYVPWMSYGFGQAVKDQCPEVASFGRVTDVSFYSKLVESDALHKYYESGFVAADNAFLQLFSFEFIKGNPKTALTRPGTMVLTEKMAAKYFGNKDPVGKIITYDKKHVYEIVGVMKDLPFNSSIQFDFLGDLMSYRANETEEMKGYLNKKQLKEQVSSIGATGSYNTYFLLNHSESKDIVASKIPSLLTSSLRIKDKKDRYELFPLFDLHFERIDKNARQKAVVFSMIGMLILSLALVNYINLTTASSSARAGEVSVRKVVGGQRIALISQFYLESVLYVTIAFTLAIAAFFALKDYFYTSLELRIDASFLTSSWFAFPLIGFYVLSILLSGSYPALLLSKLAPGKILSGSYGKSGNAASVRKVFTVFQFTVSISLIIGSVLIAKQMQLFHSKELGIDRDRIVTVFLDHEDGLSKHYQEIRQGMERISGVESVTSSSLLMYHPYGNIWELKRSDSNKKLSVNSFLVDEQFVKTMRIQWLAGPRKNSRAGIVLNQTAARELGINAGNYNQTLDLGFTTKADVIGIVKDFHFRSLNQKISPMALQMRSDTLFNNYLYIRLSKNADLKHTLSEAENVYNQYRANRAFEYAFLDDTYNKMYISEAKTGYIVYWFTGIAIVIACLGLFGLTTFSAEQRRKEIGIRKVLGATVMNIVTMLSKDFLMLVVISVLLASPIAYVIMKRWLEDFAYHVPISWWVFALAGFTGLLIAVITISFQGFRAAAANPVKSLKSE
ncbi:FtsX-like permease family protein [Dyadobacter flavalbus]|uniref:FtsX-like permease family protein n=1 Tax=Dyadobacter flavalbus TaxID=2579942 RepID=A0A5M8QUW3_9BACT|nr:ABC transporter permease [Dyadobacter flavalbus]KAA6438850.1 FtsX-like permease family protein [Dyadobacter flavalbus]